MIFFILNNTTISIFIDFLQLISTSKASVRLCVSMLHTYTIYILVFQVYLNVNYLCKLVCYNLTEIISLKMLEIYFLLFFSVDESL
jgi:hypothetical protein